MILRRAMVIVLVAVLVAALVPEFPTVAQDDDMNMIATGLNNPRGLFYADDGTLYIAEAGMGGNTETGFVGASGEPALTGATGQITMVASDGTQSVAVHNLISTDAGMGEVVGPHDVYVVDDSIWVLNGQGPVSVPDTYTLMELDAETARIKTVVDLFTLEKDQNPDGGPIDSNPIDFEVDADGNVWIVDAGCNCLLTWTPGGELEIFAVWEENPVPTSIVLGNNDDLYVSFLSPGPFFPGSAFIEHWSTDGELIETYGDKTMLVDLLMADDGTLYAVQFAIFDLEAEGLPFQPETGAVLEIGEDGSATPVAEGLTFPYGIAQAPDGTIAVAVNASFVPPGSGMVIAIER